MPTLVPTIPGYRLIDQIGRGGFGVVYLAEGEGVPGPVAIKVLHRVLDPEAAQRFAVEVQVMGTLAWHPNIVRIVDAGDTEGQPYIVMEYLPSGSLGEVLRDHGPQPLDAVTAAGVQAATGLQVAHNAGLLHRDIKPDNLLIAEDGSVKVSDFGVSLAAGAAGRRRGTTGTIAYSAPELLAGKGASTASDIYALGATLYALLTGEPAFHRDTDESPAAMILRAHRDPVPDLSEMGFPPGVARVIMRAMAKDPADRPARAEDLARELQTAREEQGLAAVPVVRAGQPAPPAGAAPGAPPSPAAAGLPDQPPPEDRRRAQRLTKVLGGVGAAAAALVAITFVAVANLPIAGDLDEDTAGDAAVEDAAEDEVPDDEIGAEDPGDVAPSPAPEPAPEATLEFEAPPPAPPAPESPQPAPAPPPPPTGYTPEVSRVFDVGTDVTAAVTAGSGLYAGTDSGFDGPEGSLAGFSVVDLALEEQAGVLGVVTGEAVELFDLADFGSSLLIDLDATEITTLGEQFVAAASTGLVPINTGAGTGDPVPLRGAAHVDAAGGVLWGASDDGRLLVVDTADGATGTYDIQARVVELTVAEDGTALLATADDGLVAVDPDGSTTSLTGEPLADVAVAGDGTVFALAGDRLVVIEEGQSIGVDGHDTVTFIEPDRRTGEVLVYSGSDQTVTLLR